ncbi:FAD-dependent monooxygenase [Actinoplanes sp. LDG1-06]|uniref:FAD-dependent monooxygenase n=1 Tax=Paractinoplanes ovalisporus TaxID=2810368 RepID=A0ABS2A8Q4_9ACTN|nr:FAD-dependent oxidoreductase [Actinoplanes ovalisporus]MBM2615619.1 FAD-dependent monooxygenase [Actinoplanes ovalisporus]
MSRVAIIGAGIGGLTTAIGLQRHGWDVTVFERSAANSPAGAGLSLFGNAFRAFDVVGVGDAVREIAGSPPRLPAGQRRRDGRWLATMPLESLRDMRVVHRADLHRVLSAALEPGTVRFGETVEEVPGGFDLVVAADGLRSGMRDTAIRYSGYTSWRAVTNRPVELDGAGESLGRGERVGLAPLPDGRVYWFGVASLPAGTHFADEYAEVRRRFDGWHSPVPQVLDAVDPAALVRTDVYELARPLTSFVRGNVVLLGDAAHAMTPDLGQGAAMAVEDAATLTHLLTTMPLSAALPAYDASRRPRTRAIARKARAMGRLLQSRSPLRDLVLRFTPTGVVTRQLESVEGWTLTSPARVKRNGNRRG